MAARISEISVYKESGKCFFFIKNPNLIKKSGEGRGGGGSVAKVSDFFSKESKSENVFFPSFGEGEGKGGLASVNEFVLQRIQIYLKIYIYKYMYFFFFYFGGGGGGGRLGAE